MEFLYLIGIFCAILLYIVIIKLLKWKYQLYKRLYYFIDNKEYLNLKKDSNK